jgi:hypothetical protein
MSELLQPRHPRYVVTTKSGSKYEFERDPASDTDHLLFGRVRKDGGEWGACSMLSYTMIGERMHIVVDPGLDSLVLITSRVVSIEPVAH